jgi:signal transduction histidine kinase
VVTVRARTTALASVVAAVVLAIAAVALLKTLDAQLTRGGDDNARTLARQLAVAPPAARSGVLEAVTDDGLVQVLGADGRVLGASSNLPAGRPIAAPATEAEDLHVETFTAPDDNETERYRVWRLAVHTDEGLVTILVGTSLESVSEATGTVRTSLLVGLPLLLALLALGTWYVVGRSLSRVERVRREVDRIGEADLSTRLEPGPPDEVGRLVQTMNAMLERIDAGQRRQRDFVADASHELQSPLTAFRAQLEVARAHPDRVDWPALTSDLLEDTDRMERLVRDLLLLASGEAPLERRVPVDLADVAGDQVERVARAGGPQIVLTVDSPAPVLGDPGQLDRVVGNLLDNARAHASTRVDVVVAADPAASWVSVGDDGLGIPADQREQVFDRFHRADPARSRLSSGTGLGLPIARALARRHGGDVLLEPSEVGARFVLRLPRPGTAGGR